MHPHPHPNLPTGEQALTKGSTRVGTHAVEAVAGRLLDPATSAATERAAAAAARSGNHSGSSLFSHLFRRGGSRASQPATAAASASSHAAAVAVGHAGEAAAVHGGGRGGMGVVELAIQRVTGSRLGRRLLTPQLLSRVGRGAMVALPAVGALFVAHLAHQVGVGEFGGPGCGVRGWGCMGVRVLGRCLLRTWRTRWVLLVWGWGAKQ